MKKVFLQVLATAFLMAIWIQANACSADYTASQSGLSASFKSTGTNSASTKYTWTFGDGTSSHDKSASHTYAKAGTYSVCLVVTDSPCSFISVRILLCQIQHIA